MSETTLQYYYRSGIFGGQVLWVKKQVKCRKYDFTLGIYRDQNYTIDRKATPSEAASLIPVINAGLPNVKE